MHMTIEHIYMCHFMYSCNWVTSRLQTFEQFMFNEIELMLLYSNDKVGTAGFQIIENGAFDF